MIIAGVDPGTALTGYAFILKSDFDEIKAIKYGCIRTDNGVSMPERLQIIYREFTKLIEYHHPDEIAIERVFFNTNAKTAIMIGQACGVVMLAAAECGVKVKMYTPLEVKMALVGYGRAHKRQVQRMVKQILTLEDIPKPDDVADALAVAICHAHSNNLTSRIEEK